MFIKKVFFLPLPGLLLIALCNFLLISCSTLNFPRPQITGQKVNDPQITASIIETSEKVKAVRLLASATVEKGKELYTFRQIILAQKPDSVRIETLPSNLGVALNLLAASNGRAIFIDNNENIRKEGEANEQFFQETFGLPISDKDFIYFLTGRVPDKLLLNNNHLIYSDADKENFQLVLPNFKQYWELDPVTKLAKKCQIRDQYKDKLIIDINYKYQDTATVNSIPEIISFFIPKYDLRITLNTSKVTVNQFFPEKLYQISQ